MIRAYLSSLFKWLAICLLSLAGLAEAEPVESQAVIFMYHRFGEDRIPSTSIRLDQFRAQLDYLAQNDYRVWPLAKVVEFVADKRPLPDRVVAITVDDAYLSVYRHAYPLLLERGWPFTVFVATDPVDRKFQSYMDWEQMRDMKAHGVTFANHSRGHGHLIEQSGGSVDERRQAIIDELRYAQQRLQDELGEVLPFFAYPYGEYDEVVAAAVTELGLIGFGQQSGALGSYTDLRAIPRYPVSDWYGDLEGFASKAASLAMPLKRIEPFNPVLAQAKPPVMRAVLARPLPRYKELRCYASQQGQIDARWQENESQPQFTAQAPQAFASRRGRYNCTIPSQQKGRYYWFSHLWVQPWLAEE